jgi:2-amino-4-hydroxy-6-hydroxymethyldihydropteridine diphosphokinase
LKTVYLSLGSNLGDRAEMLRRAIAALPGAGVEVSRASSVYETEPMELREQSWFLNLVVECRTELFPRQLLGRLKKIELSLGRKRLVPKGPRSIDIDIILYGRVVMAMPDLTIPHARFRDRRFVLAPLAELAPELRDPVSGRTIVELLKETPGQTVRKATIG